MYLDFATWRNLRNSEEMRNLNAISLGLVDPTNVPAPLEEKAKSLLKSEFKLNVHVVDRSIVLTKKGNPTTVMPWKSGAVSFLPSAVAGELQYGTSVEERHKSNVKIYQKAGKYTLVSKYSGSPDGSPKEFTESQARAIPVINVDGLYILQTS